MKNNIIITGSNGSIGFEIVKNLYKNKNNIIAIDKKKSDLLKKRFPKINYFACDLTNDKAVNNLFKKIEKKFKKIDIIINNAGYIYNSLMVSRSSSGLKKHSYKDWKKVISMNLDTVFLASSYAIENMVKNRTNGLIINISSIAANGNVGQSAYASAKSGVEALTKTLSKELSIFNIRVVGIAPGFFSTKSTKNSLSKKNIEIVKNNTPVGRLGNIDELIHAIEFVIKNKFYNGKILKIDGGYII